jgi:hypothetical protein
MISDDKTKKRIVEKIALAAILALSLLAARIIVSLKTGILMSPPVELMQSGLSVSMPSGNGWQCDKKWIYENNSFLTRSIFSTGGFSQSYAQCHYLLANEPMTPKERFDKQAEQFNGEVTQTGQLSSKQLKIEWAKIVRYANSSVSDATPEHRIEAYEIIFGICSLPAGRQLEIEVLVPEEEKEIIADVFERIVKDLRFSDNQLLQAGIAIISQTKQNDTKQQSEKNLTNLFIILDKQERAVGFTLDAVAPKSETDPTLKVITYSYQKGLMTSELIGQYKGDSSFENFNWNVKTNSRRGSKVIEMVCKENFLKVRTSQNEKENECVLSKASVPDAMVDPILYNLLDSPMQEIIIDLIRLDGNVSPVYIKKMTSSKEQSSVYVLRVESLDGSGIWQQVYYDQDKRVTKKMLWQDGSFIFRQATVEQTVQAFPQQADVINNPFGFAEKNI